MPLKQDNHTIGYVTCITLQSSSQLTHHSPSAFLFSVQRLGLWRGWLRVARYSRVWTAINHTYCQPDWPVMKWCNMLATNSGIGPVYGRCTVGCRKCGYRPNCEYCLIFPILRYSTCSLHTDNQFTTTCTCIVRFPRKWSITTLYLLHLSVIRRSLGQKSIAEVANMLGGGHLLPQKETSPSGTAKAARVSMASLRGRTIDFEI